MANYNVVRLRDEIIKFCQKDSQMLKFKISLSKFSYYCFSFFLTTLMQVVHKFSNALIIVQIPVSCTKKLILLSQNFFSDFVFTK